MSPVPHRRPRSTMATTPHFSFAFASISGSLFTPRPSLVSLATRRLTPTLRVPEATGTRVRLVLRKSTTPCPEENATMKATQETPTNPGGGSGPENDEGRDLRPVLAVGFVAFVAALVVGGWATGGLSGDTFVMLAEWFQALGPSAIFVYAVLYFLLELLAVPATPLTLGCGYLFGVGAGTAAVSVASTAAAAASFLIARYGLREYTLKLASKYPKFRALDRAIGQEGFKFVFLLRLSPLLPFALSNYLYGLTAVDFKAYVLASWAGMLPGTIAYVSAGAAVGALTDINVHHGSANPLLIAIGVAATVGAVSVIGKVATSAISETVELEDGI